MAATKESQQFRELIKRGIPQDRAIKLIQQAKTGEFPKVKESFVERTLRESKEFRDVPLIEEDEQKANIKTPKQIESEQGLGGFVTETAENIKQTGENILDIKKRFDIKTQEHDSQIQKTFQEQGLGDAFIETFKNKFLDIGSTSIQVIGEGVATVTDVAWESLENSAQLFTPEVVEEGIEGAIKSIGDTDIVKSIAESYNGFKERNPEKAATLEGTLKILEIIPGVKVKNIFKPSIDKGIDKLSKGVDKISDKIDARKELKKESIKEEKVRTTAQILQAGDDVSDASLINISNFIGKAKTTKELKEGFKKSATDIINKRNALIKEANKPITNTLLLTSSLVKKIDDLKAEGLVSPSVIKKYEERLKMEQSFVRSNKDQLDLLKIEKRKENLNKLTERLQKKKEARTLTDLENAELQALDLVRDSYKIEVENITDTFFSGTDNVGSIKNLNNQFGDLQTAIKLIGKESSKIRKSEDPAGFIRDKISKLPFIGDFVNTPSAAAAVRRQELLKKKTKSLENLK